MAAAVKSAKVEDARLHYIGFGRCPESRSGATPEVDEGWYLRTYTDVAAAVASKEVASASEHFRVIGGIGRPQPQRILCPGRGTVEKSDSLGCRALIAANDRISNKMEDSLNYTTLLEGAEEAAIKRIAGDDQMYNTGKEWYFSVGFDGLRAIMNVLTLGNVKSIGNILISVRARAGWPIPKVGFS